MTSLSGQALQASRAALNAALNDKHNNDALELGEIQEIEVDMQAQAEGIRTVFSDPKNFNVKVRLFQFFVLSHPSDDDQTASTLLPMDALVRFTVHKRT